MYVGQRDYVQPVLIGREMPPHTWTYRAADVSVNLLVLVSFAATRHRIDLSTCVGVGPRRFVCTLSVLIHTHLSLHHAPAVVVGASHSRANAKSAHTCCGAGTSIFRGSRPCSGKG